MGVEWYGEVLVLELVLVWYEYGENVWIVLGCGMDCGGGCMVWSSMV
jgi:hypothetical protein